MEETWLRRNFITIRIIWCVSVCLQLFILGNDPRIIPGVPGSRPQIDNPGLVHRAGAVRPGPGLLKFHISFQIIPEHSIQGMRFPQREGCWSRMIKIFFSNVNKGAIYVCLIRFFECVTYLYLGLTVCASPASHQLVSRLTDAPQVNVCPSQTNLLLKIVCRFPLLKRESWLHN